MGFIAEPTTALVVGGSGYIGSHTCKVLATSGFRPIVYDNLSTGHRSFVRWGPLIEGDVLDKKKLADAFATFRPSVVFHFAATSIVRESFEDPSKYYQNNVVGTLNLMDVARSYGNIPIVFSSSGAVYGEGKGFPINEDDALVPINPYGHTKVTIEHALENYDSAYGLRSVRLRYFNACGSDPDGDIGESHEPETHLIPRAILTALGTISELVVFGNDYPTPDGTTIRDYVHVCDLARAHVDAGLYLLNGGQSRSANLGTGRGYSVFEVVDAVGRVTGLGVPIRIAPRRIGEPAILVANGSCAKRLFGFSTAQSDMQFIVRTAYSWLSRDRTPSVIET